jgi:hypothetical protein
MGEHRPGASRWTQVYGPEPGPAAIETVVIGDEMWERSGDEWTAVADPAAGDVPFSHPFGVELVTTTFEYFGTGAHEGYPVEIYRAEGPGVIADLELNPEVYERGTVTAAVLANGTFATYEVVIYQNDEEWARLTYRIFDIGGEVTISRPEVIPAIVSCRDPSTQLIEEVGAYRSRYDLLHTGAAFSSIEELRLEEPWAWQQTVRFRDSDSFVETLWVNGGFQYWREPDGEWQEDLDGSYQAMTYRPFVDDLWLPDLVAAFAPIATDSVNERIVDVYELDLDDIRRLNDGLVRNTDSLAATFWIEPCSRPALVKLEVRATGRGYADGEFHVVYEVYDFGTPDVIDIPPAALED